MSVRPTTCRSGWPEVFAQMWKADAGEAGGAAGGRGGRRRAPPASASAARTWAPTAATATRKLDESLTLKRRSRMSVSHVFDAIWRWKDELQGKVRTEKLEGGHQEPDELRWRRRTATPSPPAAGRRLWSTTARRCRA